VRVAVLWTRLSGYLNACLRELAARPGVELLVAYQSAGEDAPFDASQFSWMVSRLRFEYADRPDRYALFEQTRRFSADVLLVNSWHIAEFRYVLERLRPRPLRVLCMDNQWRGTWKQRLGVIASPWYVRRLYDAAFLPGERQACFARRLGFPDDSIWQGSLCPDAATLVGEEGQPLSPLPRAFGYLGRLSSEKGIQDLLRAYEIYRASSADPWTLHVAGAGPLSPELDRHESVTRSGFVQPAELGAWMKTIGCLVVPSRFEPWGVVISEGATAGLPIIATNDCGAVPHLVHDFANGRVARAGDVRSIAGCMTYVASRSDDERLAMGRVSRGLATPYTPVRWADTILSRSSEMLADRVPR
jgi:glycosyltransferase involved in cell wall biosynthesis